MSENMPTLVYRYGIAAPHDNADLVYEQLRLAHEYRCSLVRIERTRRAEERAARLAVSAEVAAAEAAVAAADAECERLATEIRKARSDARKRVETQQMRDALAKAREVRKERKTALFELRDRYQPQCRDCRATKSEDKPCPHVGQEAQSFCLVLDAIAERAKESIRKARAESGLYWGSYLLVDRAMAASRKAPLYGDDGITPNDPKMPRFDGGGAVAIQFQSSSVRPSNVRLADLGPDNARLQIVLPPWPEQCMPAPESHQGPFDPSRPPAGMRPDGTLAPATRADGSPARWLRRRANRQALVRMCVKTEGRGKPVWAAWRLDYDRPLPAQAIISWATIHRRMRGPHAEWSLCLTVEVAAEPAAEIRSGQVAIDVGWRQMPCPGGAACHGQRTDCHELRVAAWRDHGGGSGELRLSARDIRALRQPAELRSKRDTQFDAIKAAVAGWIRSASDAPEWMREAAKVMHAWRWQGRMVALVRQWAQERPNRAAPEEAVYQAALAWQTADWALWESERARDAWAHRRRREIYRVWAARMAETYGTLILERFDLRDVTERAPVGQDDSENETARSNRHLAAVSELRGALCNAVRTRGSEVVGVTAVNSTRTCPSCGLVSDRNQAQAVQLACECGHVWDQDVEGAAPWLLAEYRERPGDAKLQAGARAEAIAAARKGKKGNDWARAKRMGAAKKGRLQAARESAATEAQ
jgi:hypothetical protein